jgi:hypothetical protein
MTIVKTCTECGADALEFTLTIDLSDVAYDNATNEVTSFEIGSSANDKSNGLVYETVVVSCADCGAHSDAIIPASVTGRWSYAEPADTANAAKLAQMLNEGVDAHDALARLGIDEEDVMSEDTSCFSIGEPMNSVIDLCDGTYVQRHGANERTWTGGTWQVHTVNHEHPTTTH